MKILKPLLFLFCLAVPPSVHATVWRDANGWTQVTPSADSRVVYVSSTTGNDANNGLSAGAPKRTIAAASALIRQGYPDHLLLKRGDEFVLPDAGLGRYVGGRNANEPTVISFYGDSGPRPVVKISQYFINHDGQTRDHLFIKGIEIYKYNSDPTFAGYVGSQNSLRFVGGGANLKIEDCLMRFLEVSVQSFTPPTNTYTNFEFRRNIVLDAWKHDSLTTKEAGKISGMFVSGVNGYLIEENFFDHNGWNESIPDAAANKYNHNLYVQYSNAAGGVMRGNISARGAAHGLQARSGGKIDRNLFVLNAVGFNIGGEAAPTDPQVHDFDNLAFDNVVLNGRRMHLGSSTEPQSGAVWGVWEPSFILNAHVDGNIVANRLESGENTAYNEKQNMSFGVNISHNWYPAQDTFNASWPHPNDDLGDYYATIGGTNSTIAYLNFLRARPLGVMSWKYTSYAAINYIRAGFSWGAIPGEYSYPDEPPTSGDGFINNELSPGQTGTFTATFHATPSHALSDAIVGFANAAPSAYTDLAAIVRFNTTGNIDARNGAAYAAASTIPYSPNLTYAFRVVVNVPAHTYSVYVTPPGSSTELTVGANYAFRTEQASVTSLNYRTARIATPSGASLMVTNFAMNSTADANLLSHGTFEPDQATVLQDMPTTYTLGTNAANIWQGRVGAASSQNVTYQTSGSAHYISVGGSANGNGAFQVITWPGTGTHTLTFQYRGANAPVVKIFGGNTGATLNKYDGDNTLTPIQTIPKSSASTWTSATHTITLSGSYNYLVIQLKGGDFDTLAIAP
jgi:hypothetical protein